MSRPVVVCHLSTMTGWGGVERMVEDVLLHSAATGGTHHLLAPSWSPEVVAPIEAAGIEMLLLHRRSRYDPRGIAQAAAWLRRKQVTILHAYNAFANIWALALSRLAGVPVFIAGEHGTVWRTSGGLFHLDRLAQRTAAAVVANSEAAAALVQQRYGVAPASVQVVANAVAPLPVVDRDALRRSLGLEDAPIIGSVGRLDNPKDQQTLLEAAALALAQRDDLRFVLVGGGPLEAELRARLQELGLNGRFIMTGWRSDARELIQAFDLFVGTSVRESFGNVFVEAALAGLPVIASAVDGIPEVVVDGQTGCLLRPRLPIRPSTASGATPIGPIALIDGRLSSPRALDPAELAQAILDLMADPERRRQLGEEARRRAQLRYGLDRHIMELTDLYQRLAGLAVG